MSVKRCRYDFQSGLVADDKGGLVSYADYEKLAAENAGLKSKGRELLGEACAVYAKLNKLIDPAIGDFIDGQTLHEFQYVLDCETPATDAFMAEVRAQGVDAAIERLNKKFEGTGHIGVPVMALEWLAHELRKGGAA